MIKVAINGFGRIGRIAFKQIMMDPGMEVIAINDLGPTEELAYLLKYDTTHRDLKSKIDYDDGGIIVNDKYTKVYNEIDPINLPWRELDIDIVIEATGKFTTTDDAMKHIEAGAKRVVISAPGKGEMKTIVYGVNEDTLTSNDIIVSAASCTTNCLAPILKLINDNFEIKYGYMSTIHAITNDQATLDISHKKGIYERRGRAFANIIPTSTGVASAIGKVIPELDGKLMGSAYRVPVMDGSMIELICTVKDIPTKEEINELFKNNISDTLEYTEDPIVSSDIIGHSCGSLVDGLKTSVNGNMIQVVAWYDNEWGYTAQMIRTMKKMFI